MTKTLQDFRNEIQEMSFKELYRMNRTGETHTSNLISTLLIKLDSEYGTEYQITESTIKVKQELSRQNTIKTEDKVNLQTALF